MAWRTRIAWNVGRVLMKPFFWQHWMGNPNGWVWIHVWRHIWDWANEICRNDPEGMQVVDREFWQRLNRKLEK